MKTLHSAVGARPRRAARTPPRLVWPPLALALILVVDGIISPHFFAIRIVEGRLFGNLVDIVYRATPIALVALGMAVVIGTKGIDLSVGSIIAIVGATLDWRIHAGDPHVVALVDRARRRPGLRPLERPAGRRARHPADHRDADPDGLRARHRADDQPDLRRRRSELREPAAAGPQRRPSRTGSRPASSSASRLARALGADPPHRVRPVPGSGRLQPARRRSWRASRRGRSNSPPISSAASWRRRRASSSPPTPIPPIPSASASISSSTPSSPSSSAAAR